MTERDDVQVVDDVPFNQGAVRYLTMRTPFNSPMNDTIDIVAKRCVDVGKSYAIGLEKHLRSSDEASCSI